MTIGKKCVASQHNYRGHISDLLAHCHTATFFVCKGSPEKGIPDEDKYNGKYPGESFRNMFTDANTSTSYELNHSQPLSASSDVSLADRLIRPRQSGQARICSQTVNKYNFICITLLT